MKLLTQLVVVGILSAFAVGSAHATIISSNAPSILLANDAGFGGTTKAALNNGNTTEEAVYFNTPGGGFGYFFGGTATVSQFDLYQKTANGRNTMKDVTVFYSGGSQNFTFADQNQNTISLPVSTSFIYVAPTTSYSHGDGNMSMAEFTVTGTAPATLRNNYVAGLSAGSFSSLGWIPNNGSTSLSQLGDGILNTLGGNAQAMWANNINPPTLANNYIQVNLGAVQPIGGVGLMQQLSSGGASYRDGITGFNLLFSNDNFASTNATASFSLAQYQGYGQFDFNPISAQYVRLVATGAYTGGDSNYGLMELQLFDALPIPEPSTALLLGFGGLLLRRTVRQRRPAVRW